MDCDMIRVRVLAALVGLACLGMGPGCGRNAYRLADVSGRVTLDGEPLAGGVVSFQPQAAGGSVAGPGATGRIDADGRYRLASIDGGSGAVVLPAGTAADLRRRVGPAVSGRCPPPPAATCRRGRGPGRSARPP